MWQQNGHLSDHDANPSCSPIVDEVVNTGGKTAKWYDVSRPTGYTNYVVSQFDDSEIADAVATVENDVALDALRSYDVLTDLAEAREIPSLVISISKDLLSILRLMRGRFTQFELQTSARMTISDLLRHPYKSLRKLGDWWMQYRYGIMPLAYSYRDLMKNLNRGICMTSRKSKVVSPQRTNVTLPGSGSTYFWTETLGEHKISATVFQQFDSTNDSVLSGLGMNPCATAWELIPYSFVIDWFVNAGDYITRRTSRPLSKYHWACISHRENYAVTKYIHYPNSDKTITFGNVLPTPWHGTSPPATAPEVISRPECSYPVERTEYQLYDRWLFGLNDAKLVVKTSLNWRRLMDSAVMAVNQLGSMNRSLKGR